VARVKQTVAGLNLPSSVRVEYGGQYEDQQKSFHDLLQVLVLALALVFGVLAGGVSQLSKRRSRF
jgi:multidrug efflux pump subunit AcrB